ncbi:MAG: DUF11 domain-containing protein [Deltaproteobacteria bacterium]|nr:DUF11 domain-containing protein [Deltaproteobacteria bacterium]
MQNQTRSRRTGRWLAAALALVLSAVLSLALSDDARASDESDAVIVKFAEGSGIGLQAGRFEAHGRTPPGLERALARRAGAQASRVFTRPDAALAEERGHARARTGRRLPDLTLFHRIKLPKGQDPEALVAELQELDIVETAYVAPPLAPLPQTPDFEPEQGYLDDPPDSIGIRIAWEIPGGRGSGVIIADVEYDWNTDHEDLSAATDAKVLLLPGETNTPPFNPDHGTAVLGELIADDNGEGVTGMVHEADIRMSPTKIDGTNSVANAINRASAVLDVGDVILIEAQTQGAHGGCDTSGQTGCVPVEYHLAEFVAIQAATALGRVVVEAAGNGSEDLDHADYAGIFDWTRDSGAIIVGAGFHPGATDPARSKIDFSTYGSRVDVQGWGRGITTTGYGDRFPGGCDSWDNCPAASHDRLYRTSFGGTSGASPIVTAAVTSIQAIAMERGDAPLTPAAMRDLLVSTGTPQQDSTAFPAADFPIGPLPNLAAALTADVEVTKSAPLTTLAGEQIFYTITVHNNGPNLAPAVVATDMLPPEVDFVVDNLALCTETVPGVVTCDFGNLAVGETASTTIKGAVAADTVLDAGGPTAIVNTVEVESALADPAEWNNVAVAGTVVEDEADLAVTKLCKPDRLLLAGQEGICTILIDNYGPSYARDVVAMDALVSDGEFTIVSAEMVGGDHGDCSKSDTTFSCIVGDLEPATTATSGRAVIEVVLTASEQVDINDLTRVLSTLTPDPDFGNNQSQGSISVEAVADLELEKTGPATAVAGTMIAYEVLVTNTGPSTAVNVVVEDALPVGVEILSVGSLSGASCNAGVPGDPFLPTTCDFGTLIPGAAGSMEMLVRILPGTEGILHNDARATSDTLDVDNSDNLATLLTAVEGEADLELTKSDFPDPVLAGEEVTYQVTITNGGPSTAREVSLSDDLPLEVGFVSATISNGTGTCVPLEVPPNRVVCDLNDLDPGEFVSVFIAAEVDPSVPDGTGIVDTATASAATPDPDPSNNTATEETMVLAEADLAITKDASFLNDNPSEGIVYSLLVSNTGPSDALDVVVVDELPLDPKKIVYVMDSGNGACAYDEGTHDVTCDFGTLPAGQSVSVDIVVDAKGSVRRITNVASVSSSTTDPDASNDTDSKEILVKGSPANPKK